jgi:predicted amidohydrolase
MNTVIKIATCQFPVSSDIANNKNYILRQMEQAKQKDAQIVHFSESCLSGYAGIDFDDLNLRDETLLKNALQEIISSAGELQIWVIVGSHYYQDGFERPFNCLYVINDQGEIITRYDKRFCTGGPGELEHLYYQPGRTVQLFQVKGIQCGVLICHEWRYPEVYREQKKLGTQILFQSWYDGNLSKEDYEKEGEELGSLITGTVRGNAANNYLWISASNTSKAESCFGAFVVRPDGRIAHQSSRNMPEVLITTIDLNEAFADPSFHWRDRAASGMLHTDENE